MVLSSNVMQKKQILKKAKKVSIPTFWHHTPWYFSPHAGQAVNNAA